jgi:hypothetical protein
MQHQAGFISANIHLSTDAGSVVNYAQWETEQHSLTGAAAACSSAFVHWVAESCVFGAIKIPQHADLTAMVHRLARHV